MKYTIAVESSRRRETRAFILAGRLTLQRTREVLAHRITSHATTMMMQRSNNEESCRSCLYTGLATCTGLSGYFLYLAMEEELHRTSKPNTFQSTIVNFMRGKPIPKQNRPFLFAMSAAWFVAGGYRLYLN